MEELLIWENRIQTRVIKRGIWDHYKFVQMIGEGASGKVFLAESTDVLYEKDDGGSCVAIKILNKERILNTPNGIFNTIQEIKVHWALEDCDGILR